MRFRASRLVGSLLVMLIAFLFSATLALAKGPPSLVRITGPGLETPIEIDDPTTLEAFSFFQFEDVEQRIAAPAIDLGEGYTVTRYIVESWGDYRPWDVVIYYPAARGGQDMAYLEGLIGDSSTQFDGHWYAVSGDGQRAMRRLIDVRRDVAIDHNEQIAYPHDGCNAM